MRFAGPGRSGPKTKQIMQYPEQCVCFANGDYIDYVKEQTRF